MKLYDFLNILAFLTIFCGVVALVDLLLQGKRAVAKDERKYNIFVEYARSFFPVFLIVLIIRSFIFQPYRVPSGSLEPTVMPGDLIFVTQYNYGLKVPIWDKVIVPISTPKRGEIALFRWPVNPGITFVKRVIGLPGDHISYIHKVFYINGVEQKQQFVKDFTEITETGTAPAKKYTENLNGLQHYIIQTPGKQDHDFKDLVVPKGMYFMIGDNRDDSEDSRYWGFVPQNYFIGKAKFVWFNVSFKPFSIDWNRIGTRL